MKKGDVFFIHCLDEILEYKVDQIKVVEPGETNDLRINPDEDYVTLITCTPYGINSHRLLIRGTRIPYEPNDEVIAGNMSRAAESTWMIEYKRALFFGGIAFAVIIIIFIIVKIILKKRKKQQTA